MQRLAIAIEKQLAEAPHCAIYEPELSRVWPEDIPNRERAIRIFAEEHSWRVRYYKDGFLVIFDKLNSSDGAKRSNRYNLRGGNIDKDVKRQRRSN